MYYQSTRWTSADLELLPDNGNRYEIIDGELLVTRAPHWDHQNAILNLSVALVTWSRSTGYGLPLITTLFGQDILSSPLLPNFEQSVAEVFS